MKKILVLVPDLTLPGGVSNYYTTLRLDAEENIRYFTVNKAHRGSPFAVACRLISNYFIFFFLVVKNRYSLVHVNPSLDRKSFYRESGFIIISRILNRKTLVFFRGWKDYFEEEIRKSKFKSFVFRHSYAKVGAYIVLGRIFKNKLIALGVPPGTDFFIESTVADSRYLKKIDLRKNVHPFKDGIKFLFLSRIEKEKGIYLAVDAFAIFRKRCPEKKASLIVAGDGAELGSVKEYVKRAGIPDVIFLGNVSGEAKRNVLAESDAMIFPSHTEGLPNCILEAMLYGMPIISRITGGIPDIIEQNVNGYLSESMEPGIFADFLFLLSEDINLYRNMSKTNHRIALERFTTEKVRERLLNIYKKILFKY